MKLEPKVKCTNNELYSIDEKKIDLSDIQKISSADLLEGNFGTLKKITSLAIKWDAIGKNEDSYNEDFLARLRDVLKALEQNESLIFITPVFNENEFNNETFTASFKHCARRIKDCENIIGFEIPSACNAEYFIEELFPKHKHYVFFSTSETVCKKSDIVKL